MSPRQITNNRESILSKFNPTPSPIQFGSEEESRNNIVAQPRSRRQTTKNKQDFQFYNNKRKNYSNLKKRSVKVDDRKY